jgi:hypothetical protein
MEFFIFISELRVFLIGVVDNFSKLAGMGEAIIGAPWDPTKPDFCARARDTPMTKPVEVSNFLIFFKK